MIDLCLHLLAGQGFGFPAQGAEGDLLRQHGFCGFQVIRPNGGEVLGGQLPGGPVGGGCTLGRQLPLGGAGGHLQSQRNGQCNCQ